VAAGCGGSGSESKKVVLVTHDSFAIPARVKADFERESGLKLTILQGGDAGEMVNRALLTKGNPQGDALFGIDNNLLSRGLDEGLFEPYTAKGLDRVDDRFELDPEHRVTPIDHADVCVDID
jgi:thiamine transport system substrate-binding protein